VLMPPCRAFVEVSRLGPLTTAFPAKIIAAELDIPQTLVNLGIPVAADPVSKLHVTFQLITAETGSAQRRRELSI
jgi:hypothetical protein